VYQTRNFQVAAYLIGMGHAFPSNERDDRGRLIFTFEDADGTAEQDAAEYLSYDPDGNECLISATRLWRASDELKRSLPPKE
jgi:hypothetical protein